MFYCQSQGDMPGRLRGLSLLQPILKRLPAIHYRAEFVNSYPEVRRLIHRRVTGFFEW